MAFNTAVKEETADLPAGTTLKSSPHNISAYDKFEDGLISGRFVKYDSGSIDKLDASTTPQIAGVAVRKITGEIGVDTYLTSGAGIDQIAEVADFGYVTVAVTDAADPSKFDVVYAINLDSDETGKATEDSGATGALEVTNAVFWEQKDTNTWLVRIKQYL